LWSAAAARRLSISGGGSVIEHAAAAAFSGVDGEKCEGVCYSNLLKTSWQPGPNA